MTTAIWQRISLTDPMNRLASHNKKFKALTIRQRHPLLHLKSHCKANKTIPFDLDTEIVLCNPWRMKATNCFRVILNALLLGKHICSDQMVLKTLLN